MTSRPNRWAWLLRDRSGRPSGLEVSIRLWRAREAIPKLSPRDVAFVDEMIRAGQLRAACERLCTAVQADGLRVPADLAHELEQLRRATGSAPRPPDA